MWILEFGGTVVSIVFEVVVQNLIVIRPTQLLRRDFGSGRQNQISAPLILTTVVTVPREAKSRAQLESVLSCRRLR